MLRQCQRSFSNKHKVNCFLSSRWVLRLFRSSRAPSCDFASQSSSCYSSGDLTTSSQVHLALTKFKNGNTIIPATFPYTAESVWQYWRMCSAILGVRRRSRVKDGADMGVRPVCIGGKDVGLPGRGNVLVARVAANRAARTLPLPCTRFCKCLQH